MEVLGDSLQLSVLDGKLAVCRLDAASSLPSWLMDAHFVSITRTADELSVVCPESAVPGDVGCNGGWRALKLEGAFDLSLVGVLASVAAPLAEAGVSIFAVSTYETDYVLVSAEQLDLAVAALRRRGHEVS